MQGVEYGIGRFLDEPYEAAKARVIEALKAEGFGVLTEIDVKATMKEKLDVDVPPHTILGACNPKLAHAAIEVEPDLGVLLPCNVVVYATDEGTRVTAVNAGAMLGMVGNERLAPIAEEVQARLNRVLESL
ncbi:MAG TPA: DUF302 domain-containing protein [Thermoleophilia bacterium]|nr:DUF302 domain-containing protein [Thermoleophilia bacterium]